VVVRTHIPINPLRVVVQAVVAVVMALGLALLGRLARLYRDTMVDRALRALVTAVAVVELEQQVLQLRL
jgi:hypothetical protein